MKKIFIEARNKQKVKLLDSIVSKLPAKVALFTTVQFIDSVAGIKKQLESAGKQALLLKPKHSKYPGQLLGCGIEKFKERFDAFLYVGDGYFHPMALMLKNDKPVFIYNPFSKQFKGLDKKMVEKIKARIKAAYAKFLSAEKVGVIISTKPGQNNKDAYKLEEKYPKKKFYFLVFDTVDFEQLTNFNFCDVFVNTACPRISYDDSDKIQKPVINIRDILSFSVFK